MVHAREEEASTVLVRPGWSTVHRGDYQRMRRSLSAALLEVEVMEPRLQLAYSRGLVPAELSANMSLVRLLLERADAVTRHTLDVAMVGCPQVVYSDQDLAQSDDR